jgi:hypothetical protein
MLPYYISLKVWECVRVYEWGVEGEEKETWIMVTMRQYSIKN